MEIMLLPRLLYLLQNNYNLITNGIEFLVKVDVNIVIVDLRIYTIYTRGKMNISETYINSFYLFVDSSKF